MGNNMVGRKCEVCGIQLYSHGFRCRRCFIEGSTRVRVSTWKVTKDKDLIRKDLEIFDKLKPEIFDTR